MNVFMFYSHVLFKIIGFGNNASLISSAATGGVNTVATLVSSLSADRFGRKGLFIEVGRQRVLRGPGAVGMAGAERDFATRGSICGTECQCLCEHDFHICHSPNIHDDAMSLEYFPETKGIPIEEMVDIWKTHPHWKRFVNDENENNDSKVEMFEGITIVKDLP
ncbi:sugar transport protein 11-like [Primulina eburnea]|uniref:sugar transport protein 11-like n=1 Tax=Primulina eburnea TaxID=1245227 RepID=UPI003C6C20EA